MPLDKHDMASQPHFTPAEIFAKCVRTGWADSVICFDAKGRLLYPSTPVILSVESESTSPDWAQAKYLEYTANDPASAAKGYAAIAEKTSDLNIAAQALQAQARCLVQAGDRQAAIELIMSSFDNEKYAHATDQQGRLIVLNVQLMALQLMGNADKPAFKQLFEKLQNRLNNYNDPEISSIQRLFLMLELKHLIPQKTDLPLLPAEELAARFIEQNQVPGQDNILHQSPLSGVWQMMTSNRQLIVLFKTDTIIDQSASEITRFTQFADVTISLTPQNVESPSTDVIHSLPAGNILPNWILTLSWNAGGQTDAVANRRIAIYLWTGILVIAAISVLAGLMAQVFRNQMRHTRLKNDLVATVSHELKTPLSSIRLLVDTLLDEKTPDPKKTREYLQLIAKENTRLSRLIDNFLAFSRMERNKQAFQFSPTSPAKIINDAVDAVRERFEQPGCRLEVDLAENLPEIMADADALVTVILNLLDNAYKYSGEEKHILLRANTENETLCISVTDNGIGLSRAATKKIFERFYQVDRRLSRNTGGCGLGLSIVKFIVNAHGGTIDVVSQAGQGSTFTVKIPCCVMNV